MARKKDVSKRVIGAMKCFADDPKQDFDKSVAIAGILNDIMDDEEVPLHSRIVVGTNIMADSISSLKHTKPLCAINAAKIALVNLEPAFMVDLRTKTGIRLSPGVSERNIALAECMKGKSLSERKRCMYMDTRKRK